MRLPPYIKINGDKIPVHQVSTLEETHCLSQWYEYLPDAWDLVPECIYSTSEAMVFARECGHAIAIYFSNDESEEKAWEIARHLLGSKFDEERYQELLKIRKEEER